MLYELVALSLLIAGFVSRDPHWYTASGVWYIASIFAGGFKFRR